MLPSTGWPRPEALTITLEHSVGTLARKRRRIRVCYAARLLVSDPCSRLRARDRRYPDGSGKEHEKPWNRNWNVAPVSHTVLCGMQRRVTYTTSRLACELTGPRAAALAPSRHAEGQHWHTHASTVVPRHVSDAGRRTTRDCMLAVICCDLCCDLL